MKTIIAILLLGAGLVAAQTYTNNILSQRLPVSDQDWAKLRVLRQIDGQTNVALAQYMTNCLEARLNGTAEAKLEDLRQSLSWQIQRCDDETKLMQIARILQ
jgi:hypothetical protein